MWCMFKADTYMRFIFCFLTDVNECEVYRLDQGGKLCVHECVNVPGSYHCSCPSGYKLLSDGRSCEGEWQEGPEDKGSFTADLAGYAARNTCDIEGRGALNSRTLSLCRGVCQPTFICTPETNGACQWNELPHPFPAEGIFGTWGVCGRLN